MPTQVQTLYPTRLDVPAEVRAQVIAILNQALANTLDLYSQTKQAHWNVKGSDFYALHELFDAMAGECSAMRMIWQKKGDGLSWGSAGNGGAGGVGISLARIFFNGGPGEHDHLVTLCPVGN